MSKSNPPSPGKITCSNCGRENVPDWNGKGLCISCTRNELLGPPSDDALREALRNLRKPDKFDPRYPIEAYEDDLVDLFTTHQAKAVAEAENNLLTKTADKVNKEYSWSEVDNWTFAFGDTLRNIYIERKLYLTNPNDTEE